MWGTMREEHPATLNPGLLGEQESLLCQATRGRPSKSRAPNTSAHTRASVAGREVTGSGGDCGKLEPKLDPTFRLQQSLSQGKMTQCSQQS